MSAYLPRSCPACGETFEPRKVGGKWTKTCSLECGYAQTAKAIRGAGNPSFKNGGRVGVHNRTQRRRWIPALQDKCAVPGCKTTAQLVLHHVSYRQVVARESGDEWDPRNALTLCQSCHASHHKGGRVLPLALLPDSAFEFAADTFGPGPGYELLRRRYSGEDPRLDALLEAWEQAA